MAGLAATTAGFTLGPANHTRAVADAGCSAETMRGAYALYGTGNASGVPLALTGRFTFDGSGNSTATMVESYGGVIDDGVLEGTYSLAPDCRGSATYTMKHYVRRTVTPGRHTSTGTKSTRSTWSWPREDSGSIGVLVDTYAQATPPGVPITDDPITGSGWGDKL